MSINKVADLDKNPYLNAPVAISSSKTSSENKIDLVARSVFWTIAILFDPAVDFFSQGLSDFLGLETLRHGTNYKNYIGIRLRGPNPSLGGYGQGATEGSDYTENFRKQSLGYFFVLKDSENFRHLPALIAKFLQNSLPRFFCGLSAGNYVQGNGSIKSSLRALIMLINVICVPTIKFRFKPEAIPLIFEDDPQMTILSDKSAAYKTNKNIDMRHIGLRGILSEGLDRDAFKRMKAHPIKVTWGLVKLINPIGVAILGALGTYLTMNKIVQLIFLSKLDPADTR